MTDAEDRVESGSRFMSTREVARYLCVNEKQIYALIKAKRIPCTRVTGKWLFPRVQIDRWIEGSAQAGFRVPREAEGGAGALLTAGSNDVALDLFSSVLRKGRPLYLMFHANTGSAAGISAVASGQADLAFSHILDPESGLYNETFVKNNFGGKGLVGLNLFHRQLGLVVRGSAMGRVKGLTDLANKGVRFVNRQKGSGTRIFIDNELRRQGIRAARIKGYGREVDTHIEAALAVLGGRADACIATLSAARVTGLDFIPLVEERFDAVVLKSVFFEEGISALMAAAAAPEFKRKLGDLSGYSMRDSGKIVFSVS